MTKNIAEWRPSMSAKPDSIGALVTALGDVTHNGRTQIERSEHPAIKTGDSIIITYIPEGFTPPELEGLSIRQLGSISVAESCMVSDSEEPITRIRCYNLLDFPDHRQVTEVFSLLRNLRYINFDRPENEQKYGHLAGKIRGPLSDEETRGLITTYIDPIVQDQNAQRFAKRF